MKYGVFLLLMLITMTAQAQTFELIGHWPANQLQQSRSGEFKVNEAGFATSDRKIEQFILCANKNYPETELFIEGIEDSDSGKFIATAAYFCNGEVNLSSCASADRKWFCPGQGLNK